MQVFALTVALAAAVCGGPGPKLYAVAHLDRYGFNDSGSTVGRQGRLRLLKQIGVDGTRLAVDWAEVEPAPGEYHWARLDSIVTELRSNGLSAYGIITYTPSWARPLGTTKAHRPEIRGSVAAGDSAFAAFAAIAARRYAGAIDQWEIWNEPNRPEFWVHVRGSSDLGPNAADYASLFRAADAAIISAVPDAEVAVGGLAANGGRTMLVAARPGAARIASPPAHVFLRALLDLGLRPKHVALHPYSGLAPGRVRCGERVPVFPDQVFDSTEVLLAHQLPSATIWITEWGVRWKDSFGGMLATSWFKRALSILACAPRVEFITVYQLQDDDADGYYLYKPGSPTGMADALSEFSRNRPNCSSPTQ